jgi:hypothetical protein
MPKEGCSLLSNMAHNWVALSTSKSGNLPSGSCRGERQSWIGIKDGMKVHKLPLSNDYVLHSAVHSFANETMSTDTPSNAKKFSIEHMSVFSIINHFWSHTELMYSVYTSLYPNSLSCSYSTHTISILLSPPDCATTPAQLTSGG